MTPEFLHYVPAINENTAFGLVCGASLAGIKSCLVLDLKLKENIYSNFNFALENKIPFLIIGCGDKTGNIKDIPKQYLVDVEKILKLDEKIVKESIPGLLIIGKDGVS